jgi:hypothetical protein
LLGFNRLPQGGESCLPIGFTATTNLNWTDSKKSESPSTVGTVAIRVEILAGISFSAGDRRVVVLMEDPRLGSMKIQKSILRSLKTNAPLTSAPFKANVDVCQLNKPKMKAMALSNPKTGAVAHRYSGRCYSYLWRKNNFYRGFDLLVANIIWYNFTYRQLFVMK